MCWWGVRVRGRGEAADDAWCAGQHAVGLPRQCGGSVVLLSDGIPLLAQDRVHGWNLWHGSLAG